MTSAVGEPRPFTHTEAGTGESVWLSAAQWDDVARLDLTALLSGVSRVVVASAHPDDETLGAGLLLAACHDAGAQVTLMLATAGEGSHPASRTWTPGLLAEVRREEMDRALEVLAPGARLVDLGLTDSALDAHEERLVDELTELVDAGTVLVAPWSHDGHADHDALGRAAAAVSSATGARLVQYPVWLWNWGEPTDLPWDRAITLGGTPQLLARKETALRCHRSQVEPLGPLPGDEAVVGASVVTRARRLVETYLLPDAGSVRAVARPVAAQDAAPFDAMYDAGDDPWGFADSVYEARKRDLVLSMLRRPQYGRVLEVGCADGALTAHLVERAEHVTALDVSREAVARVRSRALQDCTVIHGAAPKAVPEGPFDLVVLSEVGYFMEPADWTATLRRCRAALAPGGELILVHWQHDTHDIPLDGRLVHSQAAAMLDLPRTATYLDADVAVDVYGGPTSIAAEDGS